MRKIDETKKAMRAIGKILKAAKELIEAEKEFNAATEGQKNSDVQGDEIKK